MRKLTDEEKKKLILENQATSYYILSTKRGPNGDYCIFWGPNRCGYTSNLTAAGLYSIVEAIEICEGADAEFITMSDVNRIAHRTVLYPIPSDLFQVKPQ